MLSKVKKVFTNKSRKFSTNSKSNENCKTTSVVSVTSSLPDFTREFSTLTEECGYVPTVLVNASKIIEAHIEDKYLFQTQGSVGKVDYLIQILGRDRLSVPRNINIHDVVEAVKVYLNRKANPIVPDEIMTKLIENHNTGNTEDEIRIISQYRKMLPDVVPSVHFVLLLMNKVSKHALVNGMDERKLATIFVLDILKPLSVSETHGDYEKNRLERVQRLPYNIMVVEHLIRNVHIFEFAPYQQIHEPFLSPPEENIMWTSKEKQIKSFMTDSWKDLPGLARFDKLITPPKSATKHSRKRQILSREGSRESSPKLRSFSRESTDVQLGKASEGASSFQTLPTTDWSKEISEEDEKADKFKKSTKQSSFKTQESKKRKKDKVEKPTRASSLTTKQSPVECSKRESIDCGRSFHNVKRERKRPVESTSSIKSKTKLTSHLKPGVLQHSLNCKTSPDFFSKKEEMATSVDRKRFENLNKQISHDRGLTRGRIELAKPSMSPSRYKRHLEKPKKQTLGSTYCGNKVRSPGRSSPKNLSDTVGESPRRLNVVRSIASKYTKRGRLKEPKNKMFKKDEELQPWEGWITESDDISLIVRTTKNPKTFQFLEKYFMALGPNENIEKIVFDASSSTQQDSKTESKKRGRRNKANSVSSPRNKGGKYNANSSTMIQSKSLSNWPTRKGPERVVNLVDTVVSSPELLGPEEQKEVIDSTSNDEVNKNVGSSPESSKQVACSPVERSLYTSTQVDTQGVVQVKCRNSVEWTNGGDLALVKNNQKKKPKGSHSLWSKVLDWVIDTSLMGIAIFCAAYIYNVI